MQALTSLCNIKRAGLSGSTESRCSLDYQCGASVPSRSQTLTALHRLDNRSTWKWSLSIKYHQLHSMDPFAPVGSVTSKHRVEADDSGSEKRRRNRTQD